MGKSIRIYLADAEVGGIRHAEIVNWTGQALAFPRSKVSELKSWPEVRRQGVYFLLGIDEDSGQEAVYVGEAEIVAERIAQHLSGKDFWSECVAFTSKDENLTKSHIKYLESRLVKDALEAGRYAVKNASTPQESGLPRADKDAMDEFASSVRILLGVLGHKVLEPVLYPGKPAVGSPAKNEAIVGSTPSLPLVDDVLQIKAGNGYARAVRGTDALVVLAGSPLTKEIAPSLSNGYRAVRDKLIANGTIVELAGSLEFAKDYPFPSSSQAAAVLVGYMINGRNSWKDAAGRTLRDIEDAEAKALGDKLIEELAEEPISSN